MWTYTGWCWCPTPDPGRNRFGEKRYKLNCGERFGYVVSCLSVGVVPCLECSRLEIEREALGCWADVVISFEGFEIIFFCFVLICETRDDLPNLQWVVSLCQKLEE